MGWPSSYIRAATPRFYAACCPLRNCSLRLEILRGISQTLFLRRYPSSALPKAPRRLEPPATVSTASTSTVPILSYNFGSIIASFIPFLALPSFVFEQPAILILLPVALGTGVGYSTRRTFSHTSDRPGVSTMTAADKTQKTHHALKQPPLNSPAQVFGPV